MTHDHNTFHLAIRRSSLFFFIVSSALCLLVVFFAGYSIGDKPKSYNVTSKEVWYGYYRTLDSNGVSVTAKEKMSISFSSHPSVRNLDLVEAQSVGEAFNETGVKILTEWVSLGYRSNNFLVLAYATSSNEVSDGSGVYYLVKRGSSYTGCWQGFISRHNSLVRGSYVLSQENHTTKKAQKLWSTLQQPIVPADLINIGKQ